MAARSVVEFTRNVTLDAFLSDNREAEITRLAVERKLEILGEAARRVSPHFREMHPAIPWAQIIGLRNLISHEYDRVDHERIYTIAREEAPQLIALLEPLIPPLPPKEDD
ncbi:MAG: DUF86 domain-containing protein [Roseiflexus sp.]|nr:DUF86 domain-containing protein [Roseiflexus sp.]